MKETRSGDIAQELTSFWAHNLKGVILHLFLSFFLLLWLIDFVCMDLGGFFGTPLYLLSKGEKTSDVHKEEQSDKLLSMCYQQFQRGILLCMMDA